MQAMKRTFTLFQYIGLWRPEHWSAGWKTRLYYCYTCFVLLLIGTVALSELVELIKTADGIESVAKQCFMLLTLMANFGKAANILIGRGEIIALTNVLKNDPCSPRTEVEMAIQSKFEIWHRFIISCHWSIVALLVVGFVSTSCLNDIPQRMLPYAFLIHFDYDQSLLMYLIMYGYQTIALGVSAGIGVSFDIFVAGLMLQTCGQLRILKHRFHRIPQMIIDNDRIVHSGNKPDAPDLNSESKLLSQCVEHHNEIFKFSEKANELFSVMIFIQYSISTLVLCVSVFGLSTITLFSLDFIVLVVYTFSIGEQIFIYCYYGCEVTTESSSVADAIYAIDWNSLSVKMRRSLVIIMARTLRPIEFTSGWIITLNLEYFNNLLKFSYSAYNVLQHSLV